MTNIYIDGNDGTGKSTIVNLLRKLMPDKKFHDRSILTKMTDQYNLPDCLDQCKENMYIILDADIKSCQERIEKRREITGQKCDIYDSKEALFKYRNRYIRLAVKYHIPIICTTKLSIEEVLECAMAIISGDKNYVLPNPDDFDEKSFGKLDLLAEGESKIIRSIDNRYTLIEYKPSVYSHKQQRGGVVKYTDIERMEMTRNLLYLLDVENIPHAYVYIGKKYVLCERLVPDVDIPPIEVIVKKCCVGTDKHRYFDIDKKVDRFGKMVVNEYRAEYARPVVRYDYRNPNHHPTTKQPFGDYSMCDDLADRFINVEQSKKLALDTFDALDKHFKKMGIYFEDICFMITTDGSKHYSEISQDCGRYKKETEEGLNDLDKDVWRSGGSGELVHLKWRMMTNITKEYVEKIYGTIK
jgi:phosphoribosylaminoimidazole-succinocarboxamide synthase